MKNVTIALDDETHRKARIRAAELGTSLSALVKDYLNGLAEGDRPVVGGVREMQAAYQVPKADGGPPWLVDGKWVYTRDGKPRKPGAARNLPPIPGDWKEWPQDILDSFDAWPYDDPDFDPLPFSEDQLPRS